MDVLKNENKTFIEITLHINTTCYLSMDHISGNKNSMRSIEVPIDRSHADTHRIKFP